MAADSTATRQGRSFRHHGPVDWLEEIGRVFGEEISDEDLRAIAREQYKIIEYMVGHRLTGMLSEEALEQFGEHMVSGDEEASAAWLHEHCPEYPTVVTEETELLKVALARRLVAEGVPVGDRYRS